MPEDSLKRTRGRGPQRTVAIGLLAVVSLLALASSASASPWTGTVSQSREMIDPGEHGEGDTWQETTLWRFLGGDGFGPVPTNWSATGSIFYPSQFGTCDKSIEWDATGHRAEGGHVTLRKLRRKRWEYGISARTFTFPALVTGGRETYEDGSHSECLGPRTEVRGSTLEDPEEYIDGIERKVRAKRKPKVLSGSETYIDDRVFWEKTDRWVTSWQLTRAPDEDCDGIPDSRDSTSDGVCT